MVTPSFASAYYLAYGRGGGESPPPDWLAGIGWPSWFAGADAVSTYNSYGVVFGFALMTVVISLGVVVTAREGKGRWESRGWWLIIGGLSAVAVGSLMEYGIPEDVFDPGYGFLLELAGFVIIAIGTVVLGLAVHREAGVATIPSIGIALVGPVGIVAGTAIVRTSTQWTRVLAHVRCHHHRSHWVARHDPPMTAHFGFAIALQRGTFPPTLVQ